MKGVTDQHLALISWLYQSKPLPVKLDPGESWSGHYDPDTIRRGAASLAPGRSRQTVKFVARDAASRRYEGNSLDF